MGVLENPIYCKIDTNNSLLINIPKQKIIEYTTNCTKFEKNKNYFHVMDHTEPHAIRRKLILNDHPEIEKLFAKREPYITICTVGLIHFIQFFTCYAFYNYEISWKWLVTYALFIGAIFNHALFVLYHDITHFNCFKSIKLNQLTAIWCNLPQLIPSAIAFGRYHRDHHSFQGDAVNDPDLPCEFEIKFFTTSFRRILYLIFMPFFYGLRPYFKVPKDVSFMEVLNIIGCVLYGYFMYKLFSIKAVVYLLLCTYCGLSIHPVSAHVIAEHYEFFKSQDTYSYYGWMNYLNFNVGYHIEHHDFPNIPWYKLPEIKRIAPEYYDNLPSVDSYFKIVFKYIFDGDIGPWSRIVMTSYKNK